jgi:hypothetical protein
VKPRALRASPAGAAAPVAPKEMAWRRAVVHSSGSHTLVARGQLDGLPCCGTRRSNLMLAAEAPCVHRDGEAIR